jgi:hypothetical protein
MHNRHASQVAKADDDVEDALVEPETRTLRNSFIEAAARAADHSINLLDADDPVAMSNAARAFAVDYADKQAGELITGINDTTREGLGDLVAQAITGNWDVDTLADRLSDTGLFSDDRAEMIARTEINDAQNQGTLEAGKLAGGTIQKIWTLGDNPCPLCEEAADEGPVDLDEDFGDAGDAPPLHPNCECELDLVVLDESDEGEE